MPTLSSALSYALSGLATTAAQSALVSRNVTFVRDENYTRRSADVITLPGGGASLSSITRSIDRQLLEKMIGATSASANRQAVLDHIERLSAALGEAGSETSLAGRLAAFQQGLRTYEADPSSSALGAASAIAAGEVVHKLNTVSAEIAHVRADADRGIGEAVDRINALLDQFKIVNDAIIRGAGSSSDLADNLDQRDSILKLLAAETGIRTASRPNNDTVILTDSGVMLFEGRPRKLGFLPSGTLGAGAGGGAVVIDGVAVTGQGSVMPLREGTIAALVRVRDEIAPALQGQMDAVATNLLRRFAESPAGSAALPPDRPGLFTTTYVMPVPAEGEIIGGLASQLILNPLADPDHGGNPFLIRDGGFGGPAYIYNQSALSSYQDRIRALADAVDQPGAINPSLGLGAEASLRTLIIQSTAFMEQRRQAAQGERDAAGAAQARAAESLLRVTGVNIDAEMAALLDLEKTYQASSKIIGIIDAMLATLLDAVR